ncbi:nuclease-related domain-containing protein [Halobacillus sp. Nhm2S1]|uniref:nuclease-related domain-containing protein n=1 Tax=Halobacillus sp. Nhm2S1 TaxID=2866716 RepID=UPI001C737A46|nr:nuclease-related domain-containing protein [Halobacillus sp. Nhm2S1]MBX0357587.1 NERD domain-containing protein [Halobacillus sp. Nhm2S1]
MIIKQRIFPRDIEQLQALERRLDANHPQLPKVKELLKNRLSGHKGELALNFPLSYLPENYRIFHHLRLYDGTHFFQIDCLILTDQWILIVEAKNIGGELFYNQRFNFLSRTWDDGAQTFSDPVLQVRRHRRQLQQWLHLKGFPVIPIYCLVANSHPGTSINTDDPSLDIVIRTDALPEKVDEIRQKHNRDRLPTSLPEMLSKEILEGDTPNNYDYMKELSINDSDIRKGVFCTSCQRLAVGWDYGQWKCSHCSHNDKTAHHPALRDFCLLKGPKITNKSLRDFLLIKSPTVAQGILKKVSLRYEGTKKSRVYFLRY